MNQVDGSHGSGGGGESPLSRCLFPDGTELQERILRFDGDIIVGDRCRIDYGLHGEDIAICEFCKIGGIVRAEGDLRIDNFSEVNGDVLVEGDVFLGEGVKIRGKLTVMGDMNIGDNVQIERGFEARGWIVIRNPVPVIVYIFLYLFALLHLEREEELDQLLKELSGEERKDLPLVLPPKTELSEEGFSTPLQFIAGRHCRLHGYIKAEGIELGDGSVHFGSMGATGDIRIGSDVVVHGEVHAGGNVWIGANAHIMGSVRGTMIELNEGARVDGVIRASEGLVFRRGDESR